MKKRWMLASAALTILLAGGCASSQDREDAEESRQSRNTQETDGGENEQTLQESQEETADPDNRTADREEDETMSGEKRQIRVLAEDGSEIIFELNDSTAAADLYAQLPLSVEIEDFSDNEKIFYPEALDTADTPLGGWRPEPWHTMRPGEMWSCFTVNTARIRRFMSWATQCQARKKYHNSRARWSSKRFTDPACGTPWGLSPSFCEMFRQNSWRRRIRQTERSL